MVIKTGDELVLQSLKKELKVVSRKADKAKNAVDEYMSVGSEAIAIHQEFAAIVKSKDTGKKVVEALEALKIRQASVDRILKKDFIHLMDVQFDTGMTRNNLRQEISKIGYRIDIRGRNRTQKKASN